jgi:hypothetical protein
MMAYTVVNSSKGARGVGSILIEAGETREGVELTNDEALLLSDLDGVKVESDAPRRGRPPKGEAAE